MSAMKVNWREAQRFTQLLHGMAETEWRLIHRSRGTRHMYGDLNRIGDPLHPRLAKLQDLNAAGFNVYQVVNRPSREARRRVLKLGKGTRDQDIADVTALFVEIDRDEQREGENLEQLLETEAPPSMVVQSSTPNKVHGYWLVDDMPLELWQRLQPQLIERFGGDPACKNLSRIMRVPGFWHVKGEPIRSRLITAPGTVYEALELIELFDLDPEQPRRPEPNQQAVNVNSRGRLTAYVLAAVKSEHEIVSCAAEGTRNDTLNKAAVKLGSLVGAGMLAEEDARDALLDACRFNGLEEPEARATIHSGLTFGKAHPRQLEVRP